MGDAVDCEIFNGLGRQHAFLEVEEKKEKKKTMFTVKLVRGHTTKLVQAEQVDIYPAGPASGIADDPKDRTTDVLELVVKSGSHSEMFPIVDTKKTKVLGWADSVVFFDAAYIENDRGCTTEIVRPY